MSTPSDRIFARLRAVGFEVAEGSFEPFAQKLPFVTGVAWDTRTAQLALVGEIQESQEGDAWRQLLFAAAGLRHHLTTDSGAAFGSPVVLVVVDAEGERKMRTLVEDMNQRYAVFTRVDIGLVRSDQIDNDDVLDDSLASLLPRCREAREWEISKDDVRHFWERLRETVSGAAAELDDVFVGYRKTAGEVIAKKLIGDLVDRPELPALAPLWKLRLRDFRSFAEDEVDLAPVTILHGTNGSGKSAILEAMELCWAGTSQRKPWDVESGDYARHLPRDGGAAFQVGGGGGGVVVDEVLNEPTAELVRCVLSQDEVSRLVEKPPSERYEWLLAITGLELPEVDQRTDSLVRDAKKEVDGTLREAGLSPLKAINSDGLKHLHAELRGSFASQLPSSAELLGVEDLLGKVSRASYSRQQWDRDRDLRLALEAVDEMIAATSIGTEPDTAALDEASLEARRVARERRERSQSIGPLLVAIQSVRGRIGEEPSNSLDEQLLPPIPRRLAVRWLGHARGLEEVAEEFQSEAEALDDKEWSKRLGAYADSLESVTKAVPTDELEQIAGAFARPNADPAPAKREGISGEVYRAGGFSEPFDNSADAVAPLEEYVELLETQAAELEMIAAELDAHPSRGFAAHAERVLGAMCRFEVARRLRPRKGYKSPIATASESVVGELLEGRLAPIVRELLAALVRFEWYFRPPVISGKDRELVLGGIATKREDLDARLMLNAAERSVVGLAWFLALHLLQPPERRRVLAVDDPSSAFDFANQAAFVSTLRTVVRLSRPDQVIAITHDTAIAESLAEELAPVDDWPASVNRIRCKRDKEDISVSSLERRDDISRDLQFDLVRLGLIGEMPAPA